MKTAITLTVVLAMASVSYGGLVYSWESSDNDWNLSPVLNVDNAATIGVTDGSTSLGMDIPGGGNSFTLYQLKHSGFPATFLDDGLVVSFDVTTDQPNVWVGQMIQGGSPWYASGAIGFTDCSSDGATMKTTTVTYTFPTPGFASVDPNSWAEHRIILRGDNSANPSQQRRIYIDNYRVTPEPATMALLGLGGIAALIRRKR